MAAPTASPNSVKGGDHTESVASWSGRARRDDGRLTGDPPGSQRLPAPLTLGELDQAPLEQRLVLGVGEGRQPVSGRAEILGPHRPASDKLVLQCLLDELILTDGLTLGDLLQQCP